MTTKCDLEEMKHVALQAFLATPVDAWDIGWNQNTATYKNWYLYYYTQNGTNMETLWVKLDEQNILEISTTVEATTKSTDPAFVKAREIIVAVGKKAQMRIDQATCLRIQAALQGQTLWSRFQRWLARL